MHFSVMFKSMAVRSVSIIVTSVGVFLVAWHGMGEGFGELIRGELGMTRRVVASDFKDSSQSMLRKVRPLASSPKIDAASAENNAAALEAFAGTAKAMAETDFVLLLDGNGAVVASFPEGMSTTSPASPLSGLPWMGGQEQTFSNWKKQGLPYALPRPGAFMTDRWASCSWATPLPAMPLSTVSRRPPRRE